MTPEYLRLTKLAARHNWTAYTIYLVHHMLVVAIGLWLIQMGIGGPLGFVLQVSLVSLISVMIHIAIVSQVTWIRLLFNGR